MVRQPDLRSVGKEFFVKWNLLALAGVLVLIGVAHGGEKSSFTMLLTATNSTQGSSITRAQCSPAAWMGSPR